MLENLNTIRYKDRCYKFTVLQFTVLHFTVQQFTVSSLSYVLYSISKIPV